MAYFSLHKLPSLAPISASKITNKFKLKSPFRKPKRKPKPKKLTLPKLSPAVKRLIFSFLPPPLDLLANGDGGTGGGRGVWTNGGSGGDWWFGKRRGRLDFIEILGIILSMSAGSVLGLSGKEAKVLGLGVSGLRNGAVCFLLGFLICYLICEGFVFGGTKKRRRNWWTNWRM